MRFCRYKPRPHRLFVEHSLFFLVPKPPARLQEKPKPISNGRAPRHHRLLHRDRYPHAAHSGLRGLPITHLVPLQPFRPVVSHRQPHHHQPHGQHCHLLPPHVCSRASVVLNFPKLPQSQAPPRPASNNRFLTSQMGTSWRLRRHFGRQPHRRRCPGTKGGDRSCRSTGSASHRD